MFKKFKMERKCVRGNIRGVRRFCSVQPFDDDDHRTEMSTLRPVFKRLTATSERSLARIPSVKFTPKSLDRGRV